MSIPVTDWECPPPEAGERPVTITEAARLPYRVPAGATRPRKVFVSQVLAVFVEGAA